MKAIKITVQLQSVKTKVIGTQLCEFYTFEEPTKEQIKNKIEELLDIGLTIKKCSPEEGGDFGAFFFIGDMYITYGFKEIVIN